MNNKPHLTVQLDRSNPGQFFACCGLLELTDRIWPGTVGWFDCDNPQFCLHVANEKEVRADSVLLEAIVKAEISNTMTPEQVHRRQELGAMSTKELKAQSLEDEKKSLDKLWRESAIQFGSPFDLYIDWFVDRYSGGSTFKTWAGQQSVIDIATGMQRAIRTEQFVSTSSESWLTHQILGDSVPFNFDAMLGGTGSDRDVGFSRDPLNISTTTRPFTELLAFVGLQRFRPIPGSKRNRYRYFLWPEHLAPEVAAVAGFCIPQHKLRGFEFRLLYRTKYLKSFLPAKPIGG